MSVGGAHTPDTNDVERGPLAAIEQSVRTTGRERGRRLDASLRPTDEILEVIDEQPYGLPPPPPPPGYPGHGKPDLQRLVEAMQFIALVRIVAQQGALTQAGDWVRTIAHCEVLHAFKAPPEDSVAGGAVALATLGGEIGIGRQRIRARHHSASYLLNGAEYLVMALAAHAGPTGTSSFRDTGAWYRVEGNALVSVATGARRDREAMMADIRKYVASERR